MSTVERAPLTIRDYRSLPETGPRYQLIEGDLYMAPAPNRYHQTISRNLEYIILRYLEGHEIGELYHAPFDVYFDKTNAHQPDILFVANDRRSILTDAGAEGAPNLIVEILSPKTAKLDKTIKRNVFVRCGVEELWIIDPVRKTIKIYHLQENPMNPAQTWGAEDTFTSRTFPGLKFSSAKIFKA